MCVCIDILHIYTLNPCPYDRISIALLFPKNIFKEYKAFYKTVSPTTADPVWISFIYSKRHECRLARFVTQDFLTNNTIPGKSTADYR